MSVMTKLSTMPSIIILSQDLKKNFSNGKIMQKNYINFFLFFMKKIEHNFVE